MKTFQLPKKTIFSLILIIFFAVSIRYLYFVYNPTHVVSADTYGYYIIGNRILQEDFAKNIFNDERTPVYPLFLSLLMKTAGYPGTPILSHDFFRGADKIVILQQTIGVLSLVLIYFLSNSLLFTIFLSLNPMLFFWEKLLLTETLTIFFLVFTSFIFTKILKTGKFIYFFLLLLSLVFGFLLRPVYFLLPFFILPIIVLYFRKRIYLMSSILVALIFLLILVSYIRQNEKQYGYKGINRSGDINLFGKILLFNLPIEKAKDIKYFYQNIQDYRAINGDPMPYRFLEYYDRGIYEKKDLLNLLPSFNLLVIKNNLAEFAGQSLLQIPQALLEISELITEQKTTNPTVLFPALFTIYQKFQYLFFLAIIFFFPALWTFLKRPNFRNTFVFYLGIVSMYQIFLSVFLSYGEFGRLIAPAQPIIYLFVFIGCMRLSLFKRISKYKLL